MKKILNLTINKTTFNWAIILFSFILFSSFHYGNSVEETNCVEDSNSSNTFYYQGKPNRFKHIPVKSNYYISFCDLIPNREYNLIINSFDFNCESLLTNPFTNEENREINFVPTTSCLDFEVKHLCGQDEIGIVVFSIHENQQEVPQVNNPSNDDEPELPVIQVSGMGASQLITDVFIGAGCFDVTNVSGGAGAGYFSQGSTTVGFEDGVVLTTGNLGGIPGPNNTEASSGDNGGGGDADLVSLSGLLQY